MKNQIVLSLIALSLLSAPLSQAQMTNAGNYKLWHAQMMKSGCLPYYNMNHYLDHSKGGTVGTIIMVAGLGGVIVGASENPEDKALVEASFLTMLGGAAIKTVSDSIHRARINRARKLIEAAYNPDSKVRLIHDLHKINRMLRQEGVKQISSEQLKLEIRHANESQAANYCSIVRIKNNGVGLRKLMFRKQIRADVAQTLIARARRASVYGELAPAVQEYLADASDENEDDGVAEETSI